MLSGTEYNKNGPGSAKTYHYLAEIMRRFYTDRNQYLGDPASVTTLEPSTFLVLSHSGFERCVEQVPHIGNMVMQILAQRVREADRKIGTLALMDVYGRVASTLLELSVYSDGKLMVGEKLSQQDLANMVGASREMVNRILKDLSDRGFISIESKAITIINRELPPSL